MREALAKAEQPLLLGLFLPIQAGGWSASTLPRTTDWNFDYNLALVQKALNHTDVKTTSRYAHVNQTDLAIAAQSVAQKRRPWKSVQPPEETVGTKKEPAGSIPTSSF